MTPVPSTPAVFQLHNASDPDVKTSAMQAAVATSLIFVDTANSNRQGSFGLTANEITFLTVTDGDTFQDRKIVDELNVLSTVSLLLNDCLVSLVSANTGRSPNNGEAITYQTSTGKLIWGAPVYDASLDFSTTFNSMYLGSLN